LLALPALMESMEQQVQPMLARRTSLSSPPSASALPVAPVGIVEPLIRCGSRHD
jgi:hypothetical protein